jgi:hypothetical protein
MTIGQVQSRLLEAVKNAVPLSGMEDMARFQEQFRISEQLLPTVYELVADQIAADAQVESLVLTFDPWDKPRLIPRRDVLTDLAGAYRAAAGELRRQTEEVKRG